MHSNAALLEAFKQECDAKFAFLEDLHTAKKEFGLSRGDKPIASLDKYAPDRIPACYLAVQRYRLKKVVIEIAYGDRESIAVVRIFYLRSKREFALFEILRSAGINDQRADGGGMLLSPEAIQETVSALSAALRQHLGLLVDPGQELFEAAEERRRKQAVQEKEDHRRAFLARARSLAADQFRQRNYQKVVELLSPFENILSKADREKVRIARERAAGR
jgi:hypothetical protein